MRCVKDGSVLMLYVACRVHVDLFLPSLSLIHDAHSDRAL